MKNLFERNKSNTQSGITLIALLITVIVMLIIAVITFKSLSGDDKTIDYATNTLSKNQKEQLIQTIKIDISAMETEKERSLEKYELSSILSKYGTVILDNNSEITGVSVNEIGQIYISVDSNGKVTVSESANN